MERRTGFLGQFGTFENLGKYETGKLAAARWRMGCVFEILTVTSWPCFRRPRAAVSPPIPIPVVHR